MYLDCKFGLNLSLSEITLLFDLTLYLDRTLAQRKANSKVAQCMSMTERQTDRRTMELINCNRQNRLSAMLPEKTVTSNNSPHYQTLHAASRRRQSTAEWKRPSPQF